MVHTAAQSRCMAGGGDVHITIHGARDPNAVAKQVHEILMYKRTSGQATLGLA